jgi:hypothetical protein
MSRSRGEKRETRWPMLPSAKAEPTSNIHTLSANEFLGVRTKAWHRRLCWDRNRWPWQVHPIYHTLNSGEVLQVASRIPKSLAENKEPTLGVGSVAVITAIPQNINFPPNCKRRCAIPSVAMLPAKVSPPFGLNNRLPNLDTPSTLLAAALATTLGIPSH